MEKFTEVLEIKLPTLPGEKDVITILEMTPMGITDPHEGEPRCRLDCTLKLPSENTFLVAPLVFKRSTELWGEPLLPNWGYIDSQCRTNKLTVTGDTWTDAVNAAVESIKPLIESMDQRLEYWHCVHSTEGVPEGFKGAVEKIRESL